MMPRVASHVSIGRVLIYTLLAAMAIYYLLPLYVMLLTSFKSVDEIRNGNSLA